MADGAGREPPRDRAAPHPGPEQPAGPRGEAARAPGWREVLVVAGLVLAAVFGIELLSSAVPAVRDLFRGFPVTIAVLVVGTVAVLATAALRRPGR